MITIENYCKQKGVELLGIKGAFDDTVEGELKPCPLCGRIPKPMVRVDDIDGYFAAVSCFGGTCFSHAYVCAKGKGNYMDVLHAAINEWNDGIIEVNNEENVRKRHLYNMKTGSCIKDCCRTCRYCRYVRTPNITGNTIDFVCQKKGSVVFNIDSKNCDEMYRPRTPEVILSST